jgi:hypothetical protein
VKHIREGVTIPVIASSGAGMAWDFSNSVLPKDRKWRLDANFKDVGGESSVRGIAGTQHRLSAVTEFVIAAHRADQSKGRYGILIEREPDNPHDVNAI